MGNVIRLEAGEAEHLQFPDNRFDAAIVAFGARNFENLEGGLMEMRRVVKDGGQILVLEFSKPRLFLFKQLYFLYFRNILPLVGRIISKDKEAYRYLPDTVMKFPDGDDFVEHPAESRIRFDLSAPSDVWCCNDLLR